MRAITRLTVAPRCCDYNRRFGFCPIPSRYGRSLEISIFIGIARHYLTDLRPMMCAVCTDLRAAMCAVMILSRRHTPCAAMNPLMRLTFALFPCGRFRRIRPLDRRDKGPAPFSGSRPFDQAGTIREPSRDPEKSAWLRRKPSRKAVRSRSPVARRAAGRVNRPAVRQRRGAWAHGIRSPRQSEPRRAEAPAAPGASDSASCP